MVHAQTLNTRNLPSQRSDAGVMNDSYAYDANGNTVSITDDQQGISSRSMGYDGLDRLKTANGPNLWGNGSYTYDPLDNLRVSTLGSVTTTRSYDTSNRLNSLQSNTLGTTNISYDVQGNVSQRGAQAFIFDQANRLQSATNKATYRYDGLGRRSVINAADGSTSVQLYSSAGQILYSTITGGGSGAGSATRYVYLGQRLIAETKIASGASSTRYIHTDGLGSPVAHTDSAGSVVDRSRYEAYGANVNTAGSTNPVGIGFTGHVNDVDTGLIYMQQRYYDPVAGRFLSTDQVLTDTSSGASFNRYVYTSNNPYKFTDPDGRFDFCGSYRCEIFGSGAGNSNARSSSGSGAWYDVFDFFSGGALSGEGARGVEDLPSQKNLDQVREQAENAVSVAKDGAMLAANMTPMGRGVQGAQLGGRAVMFGLRAFALEERAAAVGATTLLKDPNWKAAALGAIADPKTKLMVSLDGLKGATTAEKVLSAVSQGATKAATPTNWELRQIYEAGRMKGVQFFSGGKTVVNPF